MTDTRDARLTATDLEIEYDETPREQRIRVFQHMNFEQKVNLLLVLIMSVMTIISNNVTMITTHSSKGQSFAVAHTKHTHIQ
jgi:hypothetical protein